MQTPSPYASHRPRAVADLAGSSAMRIAAWGFLYWLTFLLVLEPGNVWNAVAAGVRPHWGREAARICGGGLLGAATAPLVSWLARRFPVRGEARLRNAGLHLGFAAVLSAVLIVVAHFLALWFLDRTLSLSPDGLGGELAANELLLVFCIGAWGLLAHVRDLGDEVVDEVQSSRSGGGYLEVIEIRSRGRLHRVQTAKIAWIEAQGNYLALHVEGASVLMRETLAGLEGRLDPDRFVRVHRRAIVAAEHIAEIRPAANGDAVARLVSGQQVRVSRLYRDRLWRAAADRSPG